MTLRLILIVLLLAVVLTGIACAGELGYYLQAVRGHLQVLTLRRPLGEVIADPATSAKLRERLQLVQRVRDFASRELLLPDNASYRSYADLGRPAVVWNVVAVPEFSLTPRTWCFPVAGCVSYRGYYDESAARAFAAGLKGAGDDVDVYGVSAYSTLGWFADPVLNTFVNRSEAALAGTIFHELAHQQLYVKDDSTFSEGFAAAVEEIGLERWLGRERAGARRHDEETFKTRQEAFTALLRQTRGELESLYASGQPAEVLRRDKAAAFARLKERYQALKATWGEGTFDRWFEREPNNARLASLHTYQDLTPAFLALYRREQNDLAAFYRAVEALSRLPRDERRAKLNELVPATQ